jgi:hypothetical protein
MVSKEFFLILTIGFFLVSIILHYSIKNKFYKKKYSRSGLIPLPGTKTKQFDLTTSWAEGRLRLALFFPKMYFRKEVFWKGYLLYLLSILLMILGFVAYHFYLKS